MSSEGDAGGLTDDWATIRAERAVYEDDDCVVLDKPAGVTLVGARDGDDLMVAARAAGEWVMPAHRIDRATSGLVLLARSETAHAHLARQFRDVSVDKRYLAVVHDAQLPERGTIDLALREGRKGGVRVAAERDAIVYDEWARRWSVADDNRERPGRSATTTFARLATGDHHAAVIARPVTGRRHQLRVHFAWIGHAIVADPLYESVGSGDRMLLHSWRLTFETPAGERIDCRADPEPAFLALVGDPALPD